MSSAFDNPLISVTQKNPFLVRLLELLGAITGGLLLGCASGGSVYLAAQATGLVVAGGVLSASIFALALSVTLAVAWGLIYYKAIGQALIPQLLFSPEEKAIAKFNKQYDKDFALATQHHNTQATQVESSAKYSLSDFLILQQFKYLIAKQLLRDINQFERTSTLSDWDKKIRGFFFQKSFEPRTAWETSTTFLEYKGLIKNGKNSLILRTVLDVLSKNEKLEPKIEIEWHSYTQQLENRLNVSGDINLNAARDVVKEWLQRIPETSDEAAKDAFARIQTRYSIKLPGHSWLFRILFGIVNVIAILNATLVNSIGMGAGGLAIVSAILGLMGASLSLTGAFTTMAIFASGGFAGAFYLTRNTMKASARRFAHWWKATSSNASLKEVFLALSQRMYDNFKSKNTHSVQTLPFWVRMILAFSCAVGFAGFNLVTGMTAMAIWFTPNSILDPNLVRNLVSTVQPWYILGAGLASALVTFVVVFSFMLKFSTDYKDESDKNSLSPIAKRATQIFILISAILNTFVCTANYFSGSLWTNLWLNFLGISNPLIVVGFGLLMGISTLVIGYPVFSELNERIDGLLPKKSQAQSSELSAKPAALPSEKRFVWNDLKDPEVTLAH